MKKSILGSILALAFAATICHGPVCADEIFTAQMERAATQLVAAWLVGDDAGMSSALAKLTRFEMYNAALDDDRRGSYLSQIPPSVRTQGVPAIAAYVFMIQKERAGASLWPRDILKQAIPGGGRGGKNAYERQYGL